MMLFWSYQHLNWISPRPVLFITGDQAHSRIFSEHAYSESLGTEGTVHRSWRRTRRSLRPREPHSVGEASVLLRQASRRSEGRNRRIGNRSVFGEGTGQPDGYERNGTLHRKGGIRDRRSERHRPCGGAGVRSGRCERRGCRCFGAGQPGDGAPDRATRRSRAGGPV